MVSTLVAGAFPARTIGFEVGQQVPFVIDVAVAIRPHLDDEFANLVDLLGAKGELGRGLGADDAIGVKPDVVDTHVDQFLQPIFGDQLDIGFWASYKFKKLGYHVGLYNGVPGGNALDFDSNKDVLVRLEAFPVEGLTAGSVKG